MRVAQADTLAESETAWRPYWLKADEDTRVDGRRWRGRIEEGTGLERLT